MIRKGKREKKEHQGDFKLRIIISFLIVLTFCLIKLDYAGEPNSRIGNMMFDFLVNLFKLEGLVFKTFDIEVIFEFSILALTILIFFFTVISSQYGVKAVVLGYLLIWGLLYGMFVLQDVFDEGKFIKTSIPFFLIILVYFVLPNLRRINNQSSTDTK